MASWLLHTFIYHIYVYVRVPVHVAAGGMVLQWAKELMWTLSVTEKESDLRGQV